MMYQTSPSTIKMRSVNFTLNEYWIGMDCIVDIQGVCVLEPGRVMRSKISGSGHITVHS